MKATRPGEVIGQALESWNPDSNQDKIMVFVKVSFADPTNFFSALSMDDQGNLIMPKIKVSSLMLENYGMGSLSEATGSGQLTSSSSDPFSTSVKTSSSFTDLGGKLASIETALNQVTTKLDLANAKIEDLESRVKSLESSQSASIATSSSAVLVPATSSAQIASPSANIATSSAQVATSSAQEATNSALLTQNSTLNLTPPEILLATSSATITNLNVQSEATISGMLKAYEAQIQDNFKVFGNTTLSNTTIAGDLTVDGTFSITNGNEINVIGNPSTSSGYNTGVLYLQKSFLAQGLDIFNGKVTIDKTGNLVAVTLNADQIRINAGKSTGSATLLSGQTDVIVENDYVEEDSIIILTPQTVTNQPLAIADRIRGGFLVKISHPETFDIRFDYLIIGVNKLL